MGCNVVIALGIFPKNNKKGALIINRFIRLQIAANNSTELSNFGPIHGLVTSFRIELRG